MQQQKHNRKKINGTATGMFYFLRKLVTGEVFNFCGSVFQVELLKQHRTNVDNKIIT